MNSKAVFALLFVLTGVILGETPFSLPVVAAAGIIPDTLVITGTNLSSRHPLFAGTPAGVHVTDRRRVREIYHDLLMLPTQPTQNMCPLSIKTEYHLSFSSGISSLLTAKVWQGGCSTVTLGPHDLRTANASLERVLKETIGRTTSSGGLTPSDLQQAYALPSAIRGKGQTVAIVDAYDDPNAEADMKVYRSHFALAPCTTSNGCFQKVDERGGTHYPDPNQVWASEIALELDMVSAICPNCHLLLVEANSSSFDDLGKTVETAVHLGAHIINASYGARETPAEATAMAHYYHHPGVIITAGTGDWGFGGVSLPAAFSSVVAVGATSLSADPHHTRGWRESAWGGTGYGCSQYIPKPAWQKDKRCAKRTIPDIAAVGDPDTGVAVYDSYGGNGWETDGSTDVSSVIIAGVYALAENATKIDGSYLYRHTANLSAVAQENCTPSLAHSCIVEGLWTPNGIGAF